MDVKYVIFATVFVVIGLVIIYTAMAVGNTVISGVVSTTDSLYSAYQSNTQSITHSLGLLPVVITVALAALIIGMLLKMFVFND
jgi:hypothetical protein